MLRVIRYQRLASLPNMVWIGGCLGALSCGADRNIVAIVEHGDGGTGMGSSSAGQGGIGGDTRNSTVSAGSDGGTRRDASSNTNGGNFGGGASTTMALGGTLGGGTGGARGESIGGGTGGTIGGTSSTSATTAGIGGSAGAMNGQSTTLAIVLGGNGPSENVCFCVPPSGPTLCDGENEVAYPTCSDGCVAKYPVCIGSCLCSTPVRGDAAIGVQFECDSHASCPSASACLFAIDSATRQPISSRCL
ncbi:MAG TPA: hypothetical protein VIV60_19455 [Polyangiaceae bacterium]